MAETTLFDPEGTPIAYLAPEEENTFYLWWGEPVAYLDDTSIFGFNGKHLGWFEEGVLRDHTGKRVGFTRQTLRLAAKQEPMKTYKRKRPTRAFRKHVPFKPLFIPKPSELTVAAFLAAGRKDA